jgi:hypothetical protein
MDSSIIASVLSQLRIERNRHLCDTDKYMLVDYPISPEKLEAMKIYRQELRDFFQKNEVANYGSGLRLPERPV